jgi:hypothetical protein
VYLVRQQRRLDVGGAQQPVDLALLLGALARA